MIIVFFSLATFTCFLFLYTFRSADIVRDRQKGRAALLADQPCRKLMLALYNFFCAILATRERRGSSHDDENDEGVHAVALYKEIILYVEPLATAAATYALQFDIAF